MHHSRPDRWSNPRPYTDASLRRMKHGPLLPMEEPRISLKSMVLSTISGLFIMAGFFAAILLSAIMFE